MNSENFELIPSIDEAAQQMAHDGLLSTLEALVEQVRSGDTSRMTVVLAYEIDPNTPGAVLLHGTPGSTSYVARCINHAIDARLFPQS